MAKTPKITPTAGYVLIEPHEEERTTASGIVLPDTVSRDKPHQGKVIAVGAKSDEVGEAPCKLNDTVIYKKWGGNEYKPVGSDKELMFVKFDDILTLVK